MCGIAGIWDNKNLNNDLLKQAINMAEIMNNRGPDFKGSWIDNENGIAFAHSRLSIIDLSESANQPMTSDNQRFVLVFNGEIYNHKDLRNIIEKKNNHKKAWRSLSDTETLLSLIECFGIEEALKKTVGMFAIAVWDKQERILTLARDRFGEKPLYWGWDNLENKKKFIFASDISAFRGLETNNFSINKNALSAYFNRGCIPAPFSIFNEIQQLSPGYLIEINPKNKFSDIHPRQWWDSEFLMNSIEIISNSDDRLISELEEVLISSIKDQSFADVPVGVFLSGGIDSSLVTAILQSTSPKPISSFTISFPELFDDSKGFNEAKYANDIADFLGTNHHEFELSTKETKEIITKLPQIYTEPFSDSSQIPSHLICKEARNQGIKVALTGDGGDELFGGYNRHIFAPQFQQISSKFPQSIKEIIYRILLLSLKFSHGKRGDKIKKIALLIKNSGSLENVYKSLTSCWLNSNEILIDENKDLPNILRNSTYLRKALSPEEMLMITDLITYLPNDILVKMDRASMASSLETRAPYLDHRVAMIAWKMSADLKIKQFNYKKIGKWPLRKILGKYIPPKLFNRPKAGFAIPIGSWLRNDKKLKNWAEDLLDANLIKNEGFLDHEIVTKTWINHLEGYSNNDSQIWSILMWQAWLNEWFKR